MSIQANNLEQQAQAVWECLDVHGKRELLHEMVDGFKFKAKQIMFHQQIDKEKRPSKLDKLAADLMLADVDKVVTLLKR